MTLPTSRPLLFCLILGSLFFLSNVRLDAQTNTPPHIPAAPQWTATNAEHVYGFPEIKSGRKGTLTLNDDALTFSTKSAHSSIPRDRITAVSSGSDRVELWGTTGQIMRMVIPDGGGLAAAAIMHHSVGMLTIEFMDARGGRHAAVFNMPPHEVQAAFTTFHQSPVLEAMPATNACANGFVDTGSVLVDTPDWDHAQVPAAYRALVYEHVIARLKETKNVTRVYRDGELTPTSACPQFTIHIAAQTFKQGSQVARAALGPVGMFVGTTQLVFNVNITDATGQLNTSEQIKASIHMQSESTTVADKLAKTLAKHYTAALKNAHFTTPQAYPTNTGSVQPRLQSSFVSQ